MGILNRVDPVFRFSHTTQVTVIRPLIGKSPLLSLSVILNRCLNLSLLPINVNVYGPFRMSGPPTKFH
jgi:hypothetical protein